MSIGRKEVGGKSLFATSALGGLTPSFEGWCGESFPTQPPPYSVDELWLVPGTMASSFFPSLLLSVAIPHVQRGPDHKDSN